MVFESQKCNDFEKNGTVECRNRSRVGVRAKNASVSGFVRCVIAQAFCSPKFFGEITLNFAKLP